MLLGKYSYKWKELISERAVVTAELDELNCIDPVPSGLLRPGFLPEAIHSILRVLMSLVTCLWPLVTHLWPLVTHLWPLVTHL